MPTRALQFYNTTLLWQWLRFPGDVVFAAGALIMAWDFVRKLAPLWREPQRAAGGQVTAARPLSAEPLMQSYSRE